MAKQKLGNNDKIKKQDKSKISSDSSSTDSDTSSSSSSSSSTSSGSSSNNSDSTTSDSTTSDSSSTSNQEKRPKRCLKQANKEDQINITKGRHVKEEIQPKRPRNESSSQCVKKEHSRSSNDDRHHRKRRRRSPTPQSAKLRIGHLSRNVHKYHIKEIFATYGNIKHVEFPMDYMFPKLGRGYAFVEFVTTMEAKEAMKHMDGGMIDGQKVTVTHVFTSSLSHKDSKMLRRRSSFYRRTPLRKRYGSSRRQRWNRKSGYDSKRGWR